MGTTKTTTCKKRSTIITINTTNAMIIAMGRVTKKKKRQMQ